MAGTIFGLPLSQRVDLNGDPSAGWLIYLYQANTSTPVNSYQDTGLTVLNPWPVPADANGMMGVFWLADGSYRARGTNADGSIVYFDMPNILAIGASTGSAPPSGVDPNAIALTGDVIWNPIQGTRAGWVRANGKTIGPAASGATERANADTNALFEFLWNNFNNTICPVTSGRGGSAHSDWLTGTKAISTPDMRGMGIVGLDDMGSTVANRLLNANGINTSGGGPTVAGTWMGENFHVTTIGEMPVHAHGITEPNGGLGHLHGGGGLFDAAGITGAAAGGNSVINAVNNTGGQSTDPQPTGIAINSTGGGGGHNNQPFAMTGSFFIRL